MFPFASPDTMVGISLNGTSMAVSVGEVAFLTVMADADGNPMWGMITKSGRYVTLHLVDGQPTITSTPMFPENLE